MNEIVVPERLAVFLGYRFSDPLLYLQAITHSSYSNEHPPERSNETLAFLGDAVVDLVVAHALWARDAGAGVGLLTQRRAEIVSGKALARMADAIGLGESLRLGKGEEQTGGRGKESILAEAVEALIGALYLDGGLSVAEAFVLRLMTLAEPQDAL